MVFGSSFFERTTSTGLAPAGPATLRPTEGAPALSKDK